jgi:hypothetical protein
MRCGTPSINENVERFLFVAADAAYALQCRGCSAVYFQTTSTIAKLGRF